MLLISSCGFIELDKRAFKKIVNYYKSNTNIIIKFNIKINTFYFIKE